MKNFSILYNLKVLGLFVIAGIAFQSCKKNDDNTPAKSQEQIDIEKAYKTYKDSALYYYGPTAQTQNQFNGEATNLLLTYQNDSVSAYKEAAEVALVGLDQAGITGPKTTAIRGVKRTSTSALEIRAEALEKFRVNLR